MNFGLRNFNTADVFGITVEYELFFRFVLNFDFAAVGRVAVYPQRILVIFVLKIPQHGTLYQRSGDNIPASFYLIRKGGHHNGIAERLIERIE